MYYYISRVVYDYLAREHGFQCCGVALGGDAGTAGGVHVYLNLGEKCLYQKGIRYDADVRAKADEGYAAYRLFFICGSELLTQFVAAEGRLVNGGIFAERGEHGAYLPTVRIFYAVRHGEHFALLR